jgi:hypothetical protein
VNASGFNGAGIGSGYAAGEIAASLVGAVVIGNGSFTLLTAFSGVGFGPSRGSGSGVGDLTIRNGRFDCGGLNSTDCFDATSVTFGPGSTVAFTGSTTVVSPGWTVSGSSELYFEYLSGSSQERPEAVPLIHLASISFPVAGVYFLTVSQVEGSSPGFERVVEFNYSRSQDCAFSVPSVGKYQIAFRLVSGSVSGRLACDGLVDFSVSGAVDNFYSPVTPLSETASLAFTLNAFLHKRAGRFILKGLLFAFVTDWRF